MEVYTSGAASQALNIPASTLRRYTKQFKSHLSADAVKPRGRRYNQTDLVVLTRARELLRSGHSPTETNELLAIVDHEEIKSLVPMEQVELWLGQLGEEVRSLLLEVDSLRTANEELEARLSKLERPAWRRILQRLAGDRKED